MSRIGASVRFWGEGVGCFCHEALVRALREAFGDVTVGAVDLAHEKYTRTAVNPTLQRSAWREFLRNGPAYSFVLPSGITGRLSRYRIEFNIPEGTAGGQVSRIRDFLERLQLGQVTVEDEG